MSKLTYEDKIEIYYKKKNGQSRYSLAKEYHIRDCNISYLIRLIEDYIYYYNYNRPSYALNYKTPIQFKIDNGFYET